MNSILKYFFDDYRKQKSARWFKNLLYIFLIFKCFLWLLNYDILFGEHSLSLSYNAPASFVKSFAYIIYLSKNNTIALWCICSVLLFSTVSLIGKRSYLLIDILIYILVLNLDIKIYTTSTAGESLLVNMCFLSAWLRKEFSSSNRTYDQIKIFMHNVSLIALTLQVCIVYAYSALAKWYDADWISGESVYLTSKAFHYSRSFIVNHVDSFHFITILITYILLIYQTLFPFLVWIKKTKNYFLLFGALMHLYIAFIMGLFFFGWIMVISYVLFIDFKKR